MLAAEMATRVEIEILKDQSAEMPSNVGFLRLRRLTLRATHEDGTRGEAFRYDVVDREALDAVLMVLHSARAGAPDDPDVCLRTALRPPVALRRERALPVPDTRTDPVIWEMPAGLIEPGETGEAAVFGTAARETEEETGYQVAPAAFARLGVAVYLSPGLCGEKLHFVHAAVDRSQPTRVTATEEVEKTSRTEWVPLSEALARAARGEIEDCKTELALHRLRGLLAAPRRA
jgi:ADP-ribose pyrophosphatase